MDPAIFTPIESSTKRRHALDVAATVTANLDRYIGKGRLWDSYRGVMEHENEEGSRGAIIRVCNRWNFQGYDQTDVADGWYTPELAEEHMAREASLYTHHMAGLIGTIVPRIYDAFFGKIECRPGSGTWFKYDVVIMEDCGDPWKIECVNVCCPTLRPDVFPVL
jgi:hypothetical protein